MNKYKELKIWQKSIDLASDVYKLTSSFPDKEKYGLIQQMQRASVSIASNIAEGAGRNTKGEFKNFLGIAIGSCFELETQLVISNKLNYLSVEELTSIQIKIEEIQKMTSVLIKSLG